MLYSIFFLCALFAAEPVSAQANSVGTLEIRVKDHRDAIGDFAKLEIILQTIRVSPKSVLSLGRWQELKPATEKVDLTKVVGNRAATIFKGEIAPGSFDAIDLKLRAVEGILKKRESRSAVKNRLGPIQLPFSVKAKETTVIVLDLTVLDMSDHPPAGYELQLQGYELYSNGKLVTKIPPG